MKQANEWDAENRREHRIEGLLSGGAKSVVIDIMEARRIGSEILSNDGPQWYFIRLNPKRKDPF